MHPAAAAATTGDQMLEIIAFKLNHQQFCLRTETIREIRGWTPATPIPHAPVYVVGMMNLRGLVIPIVDLARKLGMPDAVTQERSAIVVAEVHGMNLGLLVDEVSDILSVRSQSVQPVPNIHIASGVCYSAGIIVQESGMICLLDLEQTFRDDDSGSLLAA
ncbi:chemotaxis protein CheW (plasmid) [Rhizobium sp. 32-5/1]|uniref:chemotaxis protein CheW n=1 Tax=Rhizobium sp. 32-5/1 TaxID=3019602 RepID=UPI00240D600C|nr:chemotaxis protein CheW [Rhizobium sp. 32-5/1]WEZ85571.1 chemotaxis protein CheW [Rhizobium sp. 32-5/1]